MIAGDSLYLFSTLSRKLMALPGSITCQHEKRLRLCSSFAGVDCDYSDLLTITGLCSARSSDTSEESFGLLRCCCLVSHVRLFVTSWTVAQQAPLSMGFSRQEYQSGWPFSSPGDHIDPGTKDRRVQVLCKW